MQILIIKHKLVKETCKKLSGVYYLMEINSSGKIENLFSSKFWNSNSTEFYTILKLSVLMIPMVPLNNKKRFHGIPWNWHQQFHGIRWNFECTNFDDTSSSMEFHGTWSAPISLTPEVPWNSMELGMRKLRWHEQFHGIPWNFKCANFVDTTSSMEFHGIPWNFESAKFTDTSSSIEFHGSWSVPISMTEAVPWNSMELGVRQFRWHEKFHAIPWNSMEL